MKGLIAAAAVFGVLATGIESVRAQPASAADAQGQVVALNGRVEHTVATQEQWTAARMLQPLRTAERVRTFTASRASILFIDETQVKLNAQAVLTVHQVRTAGGRASSMELQRGEAWFRTKNPRSGLTVQTPAAAAAVRGTEINLRIGNAGETVLTVVEGAAEFFNPQGTILVNAGEEGTAISGQAPTKRVILNPEDAVQWALYYPAQVAYRDLATPPTAASDIGTGFDRLRAGDPQAALLAFGAVPDDPRARIGASIAHMELGDLDNARAILSDAFADAALETERRAQLAAVALASGDVVAARAELDGVLADRSTALRPLILLSSIELRQNRKDRAIELAQRALAAHPDSVGALIAASEAAQSQFDLEAARAYLDRALALDPRDVHALVNRARVRFGTDDPRGAREDAERAASISANDAQVRSLRGFIRLADGDSVGARADFEAAAQRDPLFGEPHLGLGLLFFRDNDVEHGLQAMLKATLAEPHVALYQSYLGKAYYQARRFPEGLAALASAKRLDPGDPTPWLYASLFLRDQNEHVAALNELRHAIRLNDHRAVYRGRLLLDRDLATKNVSLAEIYRQLGFEAWGAFEALKSVETDLTNSSAHLFLAETYRGLPDRGEASRSELLQSYLHAPVNRNFFHGFNEYTALIEQPRRELDVTAELGERDRRFVDVTHRSGNERFANLAVFQFAEDAGARPNRDDRRRHGFFQGKVSLTARDDLFLSYAGDRDETGAPERVLRVFLDDAFSDLVLLQQFDRTPDATVTNRFDRDELTLGFRHHWRAGSAFTAAARRDEVEFVNEQPSSTITCDAFLVGSLGLRVNRKDQNTSRLFDVQFQQATRLGRHQLIVGHERYTLDKRSQCTEELTFLDEVVFAQDNLADRRDAGAQTYVRDEFQIARRLHLSAGISHQKVKYQDFLESKTLEVSEWNPRLGLSIQLTPATALRVAAFRQLNINALASNIAPPAVTGFAVARDEFTTAKRDELSLSLEKSAERAFVAVRVFSHDSEVPALAGSIIPEQESNATGASVFVNWIAHQRATVFAENQVFRSGVGATARYDNFARAGIHLVHPRGLFVRAALRHVTQRFVSEVPGLPRARFPLLDAAISYEFAGKRGLATLYASNALDASVEAIAIGSGIPLVSRRRALATVRWRLWQ